MNVDLEYAKADDIATKPNFNVVRYQLINAIKTNKAHQLYTSNRDSGKSWDLVMNTMFNLSNGTLKGYKKMKNHRNFRIFVEKVFKKSIQYLSYHELSDMIVPPDIKELSEIGIEFFEMKERGLTNNKIRKEEMNKQKKKEHNLVKQLKLKY